MHVGIIGAGVSGLLCAQRLLSQAGAAVQVTVFEWGRGPGGRTARRRATLPHGAEISFDHAAPFFHARSPDFRGLLAEWEAAGHAVHWPDAGESVWLGRPSNHAICRALAAGVMGAGSTLLYGRHVRSAYHDTAANEWVVRATNRADGADVEHRFDALIFSDKLLLLPNPYAVLPAAAWGPLALPATLASTGAVVLMLALERADDVPIPPLLTGSLQGPLKMLVHDSAKPGRELPAGRQLDLWVAHSTAEYAAYHLVGDDPPTLDDEDAVLAEMQALALAALADAEQSCAAEKTAPGRDGPEQPAMARVVYASVFVWDHAQPAAESRLSTSHLLDAPRRAGVCGDFFGGSEGLEGVEAAALSGRALADALLPLLRKASV